MHAPRLLRDAPRLAMSLVRRVREGVLRARAAEPLEFEQMLIRYTVGFVITIYCLFSYALEGLRGQSILATGVLLIGAWSFAFAFLFHLSRWPERRVERRAVSIIADAVGMSLLLGFGDKSAAMFSPIYLWVTLGNGFRFGLSYMYAAIVMNVGAFAIMAFCTSYWREGWQFSLGMGLSIVIIPFYVAKLIRNLRDAMIAAEAASRAKTEFISMMSHELRTPLNAILGLAQLSKITATSPKERFSAISTELAAGRLLRMVDTILKFQRIESGASERVDKDFDLLDNLNEVRAIIEPLARQKGLDFHIVFSSGIPECIRSDPDHIQTIILNLLANAVKYTKHGGVRLELGLLANALDWKVRIAVRDTGDGIAPDTQSRIFDRFVRGKQHAASAEPGVGLGLSMCRSLTELLGGAIGCESKLGEGSLFWAEIPVLLIGDDDEIQDRAAAAPERRAPVIWLGLRASRLPPPLRPLIEQSIETVDAFRGLLSDRLALSACVLVADPDRLSPEMRVMLSEALRGDRPPLVVLIKASRGASGGLADLAAAILDKADRPGAAELIETVARWRQRTAEPGEEDAPPVTLLSRSLRILVADDNALNRDVTRRMLELDGHRVILVETGDDAIHHLLEGAVDAALLDVNMPGLSGIEVSQTYKTGLGAAAHIPLIGLTADISEQTRLSCIAAGMADVLGKPVTIEQLRRAIAEHVLSPGVEEAAKTQPETATDPEPVADPQRIQLLHELFSDEKLRSQFLLSFKRDLTSSLEALGVAVRQKRPQLIRDALHAVKSSASTAGAREILSMIENVTVEVSEAEIGALASDIEAAYGRYCQYVRGDTAQPSPRPSIQMTAMR